MQMSKKIKLLVFILSLTTTLLLGVFYKVMKVIKYTKCEQIVFGNTEYEGGDNFKTLHEECMKR